MELAYRLNGTKVPYDSKDANVRILIEGNTLQIDCNGLPRIEYFSYGGWNARKYLPEGLKDIILKDIPEEMKFAVITSLPFPKDIAQNYADNMEKLYRGLPPATDGTILSSRMDF